MHSLWNFFLRKWRKDCGPMWGDVPPPFPILHPANQVISTREEREAKYLALVTTFPISWSQLETWSNFYQRFLLWGPQMLPFNSSRYCHKILKNINKNFLRKKLFSTKYSKSFLFSVVIIRFLKFESSKVLFHNSIEEDC